MTIEIVSRARQPEVWCWLYGWLFQLITTGPETATVAILLGGDRWSCCELAAVAKEDDQIVGMATIAPEGEMRSGPPTIVGLYVLPQYRRGGIGTRLMEAAVRECAQRQLTPVCVDVLSTGAKRTLAKLPAELKPHLKVNDFGSYVLDVMVRPV